MPQPIEYIKDELLTRIAVDYANASLIADRVFPRIDVDKETGSYYVYDKSKFTIEQDLRSGIARANRVDYGMSMANYGPLLEHSLEQGVTDREKKLMGEERSRRNATNNVMAKIMLNHEKTVADLLTNTAVVTQNVTLAGNDQWSAVHADSDPFADIQLGLDTIDATGIIGDRKVLVLGYQVWTKLRNHALVTARLGNAALKVPASLEQLAALFDVDEVIVASAKYNTAKEGQTPSLSYVWGKNAILMLMNSDAGIERVNPGYTLQLTTEGASARYIDRWDDRVVKTEFVRANDYFEAKLVAAEAAYLIKNAVA